MNNLSYFRSNPNKLSSNEAKGFYKNNVIIIIKCYKTVGRSTII